MARKWVNPDGYKIDLPFLRTVARPAPGSWFRRARCNTVHPNPRVRSDLFCGPDADETPAERFAREQVALKVCAACPVRMSCLHHAVRAGERVGVWGGTTDRQRSRFFRAWNRDQRLPVACDVCGTPMVKGSDAERAICSARCRRVA